MPWEKINGSVLVKMVGACMAKGIRATRKNSIRKLKRSIVLVKLLSTNGARSSYKAEMDRFVQKTATEMIHVRLATRNTNSMSL